MTEQCNKDRIDDILNDPVCKRVYAALLFKHRHMPGYKFMKLPMAEYEAAMEFLATHFPFPSTHAGHAGRLASQWPNDPTVLEYYLLLESKKIQAQITPSLDEVISQTLRLIDECKFELSQLHPNNKVFKETKSLMGTALEALDLYKKLISNESDH